MQARIIATVFLALFAFCFSFPAAAQQDYPRDITLSWTNPSLNTDGSQIQPGELKEIRLKCDRHDGTNAFDILVPLTDQGPGDAMAQTVVGGIPQPGTYSCVGFAINIDDISSDASGVATRKYTGKPGPPENLVINP